eukprot:3676123-Rhodomonas_salina.4
MNRQTHTHTGKKKGKKNLGWKGATLRGEETPATFQDEEAPLPPFQLLVAAQPRRSVPDIA